MASLLVTSELLQRSVDMVLNKIKIQRKAKKLLIFSGIICIFVLGGFVFINFYRKEEGFVTDIPQTEDPHKVNFTEIISKRFLSIDNIFCRLDLESSAYYPIPRHNYITTIYEI